MNPQPVNETAHDWNEAIARIPAVLAAFEQASTDLKIAEMAYSAEKTPEPSGAIIYLRGRSIPMEQAHENLKADWAAWSAHDDAVRVRFGLDSKEQAYADTLASFVGAIRDAMAIPAPDLAALRWKLEHLVDETPGASIETNESLDVIRADMARLMGVAA